MFESFFSFFSIIMQELVKYSTRLGENCDDLQKALELMLGIPHRATDNKFISNIEGYKGNIHKLGRLLTHVSISNRSINRDYVLNTMFYT